MRVNSDCSCAPSGRKCFDGIDEVIGRIARQMLGRDVHGRVLLRIVVNSNSAVLDQLLQKEKAQRDAFCF